MMAHTTSAGNLSSFLIYRKKEKSEIGEVSRSLDPTRVMNVQYRIRFELSWLYHTLGTTEKVKHAKGATLLQEVIGALLDFSTNRDRYTCTELLLEACQLSRVQIVDCTTF